MLTVLHGERRVGQLWTVERTLHFRYDAEWRMAPDAAVIGAIWELRLSRAGDSSVRFVAAVMLFLDRFFLFRGQNLLNSSYSRKRVSSFQRLTGFPHSRE